MAFVVIYAGAAALFIVVFKNATAYQLAVARVSAHPAAISALGTPIEAGFPFGNIATSGPDGHADLSFWVGGPKAEGTVYLTAKKTFGRWTIDRIAFGIKGSTDRIDLRDAATRNSGSRGTSERIDTARNRP